MTISSSLNAGVAGLRSNASRLASISDNIANSATFGYKRSVTDFHSMVADSGGSVYSAGGVRTTNDRMISQSGSLIGTTNATDIAVRGRGMLPVTTEASLNANTGNHERMMTTTGSFYMNEDGYLTTSSGLALLGWPANADGTVPNYPQDTMDQLVPIRIDRNEYQGAPTTQATLAANLPSTSAVAGAPGDPERLSIEYYDNLAVSQSLTVDFTPTGNANEWTMAIRDSGSGGAVIGEYTMLFDSSAANGGTIASVNQTSGPSLPYDAATGTIPVVTAGGTIQLDIGMPLQRSGISQVANQFFPGEISRDGYPAGSMVNLEVDENGYVRAFYDNGVGRTLYQIPLVDVPNVNGLKVGDAQTYQLTSESGDMVLWGAGDGPTGQIMSFALEESATDVAAELTDLIKTQRAYSSNAKVIQTVDEMLQETTNLKR